MIWFIIALIVVIDFVLAVRLNITHRRLHRVYFKHYADTMQLTEKQKERIRYELSWKIGAESTVDPFWGIRMMRAFMEESDIPEVRDAQKSAFLSVAKFMFGALALFVAILFR